MADGQFGEKTKHLKMTKILHVATFTGNIGDNASHLGFKKILDEQFPEGYDIDQLEIRKTYKVYTLRDKWRFDESFARKANQYDFVLIGGGHFLDFWVQNSQTGTTLDISDEVLKMIKVPFFIISMGCMHRTIIPEGNIPKLRAFLDKLLNRKKTFVAVRNDSSKRVLQEQIGEKYYQTIPEVLDSGFFYENDGSLYRSSDREYVMMNSTIDQLSMKSFNVKEIDSDQYTQQLRKVVTRIIEETDYQVAFAPHIYADYEAIRNLLANVNDFHIRERVGITPYAQGNYGCEQIFSAYKNSSLMIGMRFHANVCSLSMDVPSVGLGATDRVVNIYESLGIEDRLVKVDHEFESTIMSKVHAFAKNGREAMSDCSGNLERKRQETRETYRAMFELL